MCIYNNYYTSTTLLQVIEVQSRVITGFNKAKQSIITHTIYNEQEIKSCWLVECTAVVTVELLRSQSDMSDQSNVRESHAVHGYVCTL